LVLIFVLRNELSSPQDTPCNTNIVTPIKIRRVDFIVAYVQFKRLCQSKAQI
jgi:hypothetical protein